MRNNVVVAGIIIVLLTGLLIGLLLSGKRTDPVFRNLKNTINSKNKELKYLEKVLRQEKKEESEIKYFVQNGVLFMEGNGTSSAILKNIVLKNGLTIQVNGVILRKNNTQIKLLPGDVLFSDGTLILSSGPASGN